MARDLFHEFGIENLGGLTAALNNALANTVQSMRYKAEHPGVHIIQTSTGVRRRSPTLEAGPGELVTRQVVAGAAAVWTAKRPWEIGRAKMLEAVCSCMLYLRNVEGFRKLMKDNHDFAAAVAQVSLRGGGGWEENGNYPDRFDKTLENLGRFQNMVSSPPSA